MMNSLVGRWRRRAISALAVVGGGSLVMNEFK